MDRLDEPEFIAVSKPLLTEFGIHQTLKSCGPLIFLKVNPLHNTCDTLNIRIQIHSEMIKKPLIEKARPL